MKTKTRKLAAVIAAIAMSAATLLGVTMLGHAAPAKAEESGVLYFVDAGTNVNDDTMAGRFLGDLHSTYDQAYGEDAVTGYSWGYEGANGGTLGHYQDTQPLHSVLSGDGFNDKTIVYKFEIPAAGEYEIGLATSDPWGHEARGAKVAISGDNITPDNETAEFTVQQVKNGVGYGVKGITTVAENVTLTLTVTSTNDESPHIAVVLLQKKGVKVPLYAEYSSNYLNEEQGLNYPVKEAGTLQLGSDFSDMKQSVDVVMSDGTTAAYSFDNEHVSVSTAVDKFAYGGIVTNTITINDGWQKDLVITNEYSLISAEDGESEIYYNVDCQTDGTYWNDKESDYGTKQGESYDQKYENDATWGYTAPSGEPSSGWKDENPETSMWYDIGKDGKSLYYTFEGFSANEILNVEVISYLPDWGNRDAVLKVKGQEEYTADYTIKQNEVSSVSLIAYADSEGKLVVEVVKADGSGDATLSQIIIKKMGTSETPAKIGAEKTSYDRNTETIDLTIAEGATVYVTDAQNKYLGSFTGEGTTAKLEVSKFLKDGANSLTLVQAPLGAVEASEALTLNFYNVEFDVQYNDAKTEATVTVTAEGITLPTVTLKKEGYNETAENEPFTFKVTENGVYTLTVTGGGTTYETEVTIEGLKQQEALSSITLSASATEVEEGTAVTITATLSPSGASAEIEWYVNGEKVEASGLTYTLASTAKAGSYKVKAKAGEIESAELTVTVTAKQQSGDSSIADSSTQPTQSNTSTDSQSESKKGCGKGCKSSMGVSVFGLALVAGAIAIKRKKN